MGFYRVTRSAKARLIESLNQRLQEYMAKKGLRSTAQRRTVTDVFFRSEEHLSIEELLALVR
ncbi:MAG: hypothetical protein AAGF12_43355, partial [Myxococcota bacterium]